MDSQLILANPETYQYIIKAYRERVKDNKVEILCCVWSKTDKRNGKGRQRFIFFLDPYFLTRIFKFVLRDTYTFVILKYY